MYWCLKILIKSNCLNGALSCLRQLLEIESPLKWWKILFISTQKLFSFSRYISFCLDFLVIKKNDLIKKTRLISKFVTSQSGSQTIAMQILINISRSKGNQTMKFGQLKEYKKYFSWKIILKMCWRNYSQTLF